MRPKYLVDKDVLIDHLNGVGKATAWLEGLVEGEAVISVITRAEVLSGASEQEKAKILLLLESYDCLVIQRHTADKAAELRRLKPWKLPDAFQAALCILGNLTLVTRNTDDFDPDRHGFVLVPYTL